jgi:hypothetical protein
MFFFFHRQAKIKQDFYEMEDYSTQAVIQQS